MTSPYCLMELEYARLLGKRIIPINQMVIFDTTEQELSAGDKQVLIGFYKFYNLPDQNISTTQDVLNRSHTLIGRTDWLDAKEKVSDSDCQRLVEWAQPYENNWAKHDDLDYLKTFEFPIFGESIDALGGVLERITAVFSQQKNYVHRHTEILTDALHWEKNQRATHHLLVGKERVAAEDWLLTEFLPPKQPPCKPSTFVCDFIQPVPTVLQQDFIQDSRKAIKKANRRRNILFSFVGALAVMAVISTIFAVYKMNEAETQRQETEKQRKALYKRTDFTLETYTKELIQKQKDWKIFLVPKLRLGMPSRFAPQSNT